ncbi:MAG: hypothetical protein ACI8XW_003319 [Gammaproteobacteria bacterium]|jgi:uncharacterized protein YyaL (SSP411 family)
MTNSLALESSPYLQQHADNPVDWLPWSPASLLRAKQENKPILLSIGYSSCHWCHVMAHESFENIDTAAIMNANFINIKIDREERPDIDRIYQTAHQIMVRRPGGWPLTVFLSPEDHLPFFAGTYFPDQPRHGMIAFADLLTRLTDVYHDEPDKITAQGNAIQQAFMEIEMHENSNQQAADIASIERFDAQLLEIYDKEFGGFGRAPKFPQPAILMRALTRASAQGENSKLYAAIDFSLQKMAMGGLQDHLAGGFYRYSTDNQWMIPHFEKMLYDNGQMLMVFAQAFRLTARPIFQQAVEGIVRWLGSEMQDASGSFYAALDADSEGIEGRYYIWNKENVAELIGPDIFSAFAYQFGLDQSANFEGDWHLHQHHADATVADYFSIELSDFLRLKNEARLELLASRKQRIRPGLDNKILTSWNALVIRGLAISARVFADKSYYQQAQRCLRAMQDNFRESGRLRAVVNNGTQSIPAYLDDYAQLLQATIDCLQFEWQQRDFEFAENLAEQLLDFFEDKVHGGFFFTASDHETLIQRPKSWQDEAMPCGNAVAALALNQLGLLSGNQSYVQAAEKALQSAADSINQSPLYAASFQSLLEALNQPATQLIVRGNQRDLEDWRSEILPILNNKQSAYFIPADATGLPPIIAEKSCDKLPRAWLCEGFSCRAPVDQLEQLIALLKESMN